MPDRVYKIVDQAAWAASQAAGELVWSELDRADGFIHMSEAGQLAGTLARHYAGRDDLVVLVVLVAELDPNALRFEPPARNRELRDPRPVELFPHYYARLSTDAIERAVPVPELNCLHAPPELKSLV